VLQVNGLVLGEVFGVYNIQGQVLQKGKADATEARIYLSERGIYMVIAGNKAVKVRF
jgi:hypothetical protein